jgi:hypothetical protein
MSILHIILFLLGGNHGGIIMPPWWNTQIGFGIFWWTQVEVYGLSWLNGKPLQFAYWWQKIKISWWCQCTGSFLCLFQLHSALNIQWMSGTPRRCPGDLYLTAMLFSSLPGRVRILLRVNTRIPRVIWSLLHIVRRRFGSRIVTWHFGSHILTWLEGHPFGWCDSVTKSEVMFWCYKVVWW